MERNDLGRLIARLAVSVIAADGRITASELAALERLDELGLGPLAPVARAEIERAVHVPVDVEATCAALPPLPDEAATLLVAVLADIAASDRVLAPRERETFTTVADRLGVEPAVAARLLEVAAGHLPSEPPPEPPSRAGERAGAADAARLQALRRLGLEPGASRADVDAAYLGLVRRYDPAKVAELGPEFAALAIRRLAAATDAYDVAVAAASA